MSNCYTAGTAITVTGNITLTAEYAKKYGCVESGGVYACAEKADGPFASLSLCEDHGCYGCSGRPGEGACLSGKGAADSNCEGADCSCVNDGWHLWCQVSVHDRIVYAGDDANAREACRTPRYYVHDEPVPIRNDSPTAPCDWTQCPECWVTSPGIYYYVNYDEQGNWLSILEARGGFPTEWEITGFRHDWYWLECGPTETYLRYERIDAASSPYGRMCMFAEPGYRWYNC